jgi:hypothetical protein
MDQAQLPSVSESFDGLEQPYDWQNVPRYRGGNRVTRNKLNPVNGGHGKLRLPMARVAKAAIRAPGGKGRGAAPDYDNGYWNLVAGACFLLFFLYIVAHNELGTWAKILFWAPAKPVQVGDSPTPAAVQAAGAAALGQINPAAGIGALPFALPNLIMGAGGGSGGAGIPGVAATPTTPWGSGPGGILGSGFWNGPVGGMLKKFGYGK